MAICCETLGGEEPDPGTLKLHGDGEVAVSCSVAEALGGHPVPGLGGGGPHDEHEII